MSLSNLVKLFTHKALFSTNFYLLPRQDGAFRDSGFMERWGRIWIAELLISPEVDRKIRLKHGLSTQFLISEFVGAQGVSGKVLYDLTNGERFMVAKLQDPLPRVTLFLDAVDLDYSIWSVRTAFFTRKLNELGG